jgi:glycosyltransferase involved in cell wall biosynthesis
MMAANAKAASERVVVMLCTGGRGGMSAVVEGYRADGLFDRYPIRLIETNRNGSLWQRLCVWVPAYLTVCTLLLRRQVSALHSHMAMRGSFWRKLAFNVIARAFGVPVMAHLHGSEFKGFYAAQPAWRKRLIGAEFARCQRVLVLSEGWADFVRSIAPTARVSVLPNYVRVPALASEVRPGEGPITALFLGEIGARKGIYDLIPALSRALKSAPHLRLQIGGSGELDKARAAAQDHQLDSHIDFAGWVVGERKIAALRAAHIYVLPSHNEGLPISILEAMSYGLPIIATRVGGIPELVREGTDGLLVDAGDIDALATALSTLAQNPAQRHRMGKAARDHVSQHFSDAAVLPLLYAYYDELLHTDKAPELNPRAPR